MLGAVCFHAFLSIGLSTFITGGLRSCEGKLTHLGITAPSRSMLAYANEHRPWELYQKVFLNLLDQCRSKFSGKKKFRFKNTLVSLDSSTIDLSLALFDWAKFRRTKGAVKLHLILDHDGDLPSFLCCYYRRQCFRRKDDTSATL